MKKNLGNKELGYVFIWFFVWLIISEFIVFLAVTVFLIFNYGNVKPILFLESLVKSSPIMFIFLLGFIGGFITRGVERKSFTIHLERASPWEKYMMIAQIRKSIPGVDDKEKQLMISGLPDSFLPGGG